MAHSDQTHRKGGDLICFVAREQEVGRDDLIADAFERRGNNFK